MFKVIWLLKAMPGVSHSAFREWYETSHAVISEKYFGHLLLVYRRNYPASVSGTPQFDYDCITEWVMESEAAFDEIMAIFNDPVLGPDRLAALQFAANYWANLLPSAFPGETIHVDASLDLIVLARQFQPAD